VSGFPARRLDRGLTCPHCKNPGYYEMLHRTRDLAVGCYEYGNEGFL
jgi:hypothetical protein